VYELTIPSSHNTSSITKIVQSTLVLRSQVLNSTHKGKSGRDEPDFPFFREFVTLRSAALAALLLIVLLLILILSSRIPLGNVLLILLRLIWKLPRFLRLAGLLARILLGIVCHEKYSLRNASCGAIADCSAHSWLQEWGLQLSAEVIQPEVIISKAL